MRRIFAALFLLSAALCWAQYRLTDDFIQEGRATQDIQSSGMNVAHPSLPIGSRPIIRNNSTHQEVEVTVIGRIPASSDRIIDISSDTARAIGLQAGQTVTIFFHPRAEAIVEAPPPAEPPPPPPSAPPPPPPPPPVAAAQPEPQPPPPAPVAAAPERQAEPQQPLNVTVNAYLVNPDAPQPAAPQPSVPAPQPESQPPIIVQQQTAPQSGVPSPELNWLAWLSYMTAESRGRDITAQGLQQQPQPQAQPQQAPPPQIIYVLPSGEIINPQPQPQVQFIQPQAQPVQPQAFSAPPPAPAPQVQPAPQPQVQPQQIQPQVQPQAQVQQQPQAQPQPVQPQVSAQYSSPPQQPVDSAARQPQVIYIVPSPAIQDRAAQPQAQPVQPQAFSAPPPAPAPQVPAPQAQPAQPQAQPAQPQASAQPTIRVLPGIPDPNTNRVYSLQVGNYPTEAHALQIVQQLRGIGFEAVHEQQAGLFRVFVIGVPAASVNFAVQRLLVMGYTEIWILE